MSMPNPKPVKVLEVETIKLVREFYESDNVSHIMPGKKRFCVRN